MKLKSGRCVRTCTTNLLLRAVFTASLDKEKLKSLPACKKCSDFHSQNIVREHLKDCIKGVEKLQKEREKA